MTVAIVDIQKLRKITGASLADCKEVLTEAAGSMGKAVELVRERGLTIIAKRSDRKASNGYVSVKIDKDLTAMVALKYGTNFVASGKDFIERTQNTLDAAVAAKARTIDEVLALKLADERDVATTVKLRSDIISGKMELGGYRFLEGENVEAYNHISKNVLCTIIQTNKPAKEQAHNVTIQAIAMNPVALSEESVSQEVKDAEYRVAVEGTKGEQIGGAITAALRKAGFNLYIAESEEHMEEDLRRGETAAEQADEIRKIEAKIAADKKEHLQENMVQNTAKDRMNKFFREGCLLNQEYIQDSKITVSEYLRQTDKDLSIVDFKRFSLRAD